MVHVVAITGSPSHQIKETLQYLLSALKHFQSTAPELAGIN